MRLILFFIVVTLIWVGGHVYVGRRMISGSGLSARWRRAVWALLALVATIPLLAVFSGRLALGASGALNTVGYLLMGFSSLLVTFVAFGDLARLAEWGARRVRKAQELNLDRRAFFGRVFRAGTAGTAVGLTGFGYREAFRLPRLIERDILIDDLPLGLEGFRIAQLSDVHIGPMLGREYLERLVELTNAQNPDLVAVTGDLVDGYVDDMRESVAPLRGLTATHGSFFITGNHEYFWDGPAWCAEAKRLGMNVLLNEHRVIEQRGAQLVIAGVTDRSAGRRVPDHESDPTAAVAGAPKGVPVVMLAHQPRSVFAVQEAGADLVLCGHTHGGQYFPMNILVHLFQPYVAGLHRLERMWVYVSRGSGFWGPPNRVGAPSEVTVLTLRRA